MRLAFKGSPSAPLTPPARRLHRRLSSPPAQAGGVTRCGGSETRPYPARRTRRVSSNRGGGVVPRSGAVCRKVKAAPAGDRPEVGWTEVRETHPRTLSARFCVHGDGLLRR